MIILLLYLVTFCYGQSYRNYFRANWECFDNECEMISCEDGFADCNGLPVDGCEVNINMEANHCGYCNVPCSSVVNGMPTCILGKCYVGICNVGFADCNGNPLDGCERNLQTDSTNCGRCDHVCSTNCINGVCATPVYSGSAAPYTSVACVSTSSTGTGTEAINQGHLYQVLGINSISPDQCVYYCISAAIKYNVPISFFTLAVDISAKNVINTMCTCYSGTTFDTTPTTCNGARCTCPNGYGTTSCYTSDLCGVGSWQVYAMS